jgi:hypothetical protein
MQRRLLDINPEGKLFREIKDISEELYICTLIKTQQQTVAKTFLKHVGQILGTKPPRTPLLEPMLDNIAHKLITHPDDSTEWTMQYAKDLLEDMQNQLAELDYLKQAAEHTENGVGIAHVSRGIANYG